MKTTRIISFFLAIGSAAMAFAADPSGTWKWTVQSPNGEIETTLKLESKDGKLIGAYSNQFETLRSATLALRMTSWRSTWYAISAETRFS